ncbi:hypothetical protein ACC687_40815, partial [Rhizobium ruizarguesonis]
DSRRREETEVPVIWPQGDIPISGGNAGKSEDVAETILFLASDRAGTLYSRQRPAERLSS